MQEDYPNPKKADGITNQSFEFNIDQVVFHGFPLIGFHRIREFLEHELTHLFVEKGVPASLTHGGTFSQMNTKPFNISTNSKIDTIGKQIAQSVYSGFTK